MPFKVEIRVKNNQTTDVLCVIPQGHVFENKKIGTGRQNVAASRDYEILIPAGSTVAVEIDAYCLNRSYAPPAGPGNVSVFKVAKPFSTQSELWQLMQPHD